VDRHILLLLISYLLLGKRKIEIDDEKLAEVIKIENMKTQMQKAVDRMKEEYMKNLSLRSTTGSVISDLFKLTY
jgi:hypothetical protein